MEQKSKKKTKKTQQPSGDPSVPSDSASTAAAAPAAAADAVVNEEGGSGTVEAGMALQSRFSVKLDFPFDLKTA